MQTHELLYKIEFQNSSKEWTLSSNSPVGTDAYIVFALYPSCIPMRTSVGVNPLAGNLRIDREAVSTGDETKVFKEISRAYRAWPRRQASLLIATTSDRDRC